MIKREELSNPASCMSRAADDEMTFVLLGRDKATPAAIRAWVAERLRLRKNKPDDQQILSALADVEHIVAEHAAPDDQPNDERTAPAPAANRDVLCKTPGCNYTMAPLEKDGWYVCTKCRVVYQVQAAAEQEDGE